MTSVDENRRALRAYMATFAPEAFNMDVPVYRGDRAASIGCTIVFAGLLWPDVQREEAVSEGEYFAIYKDRLSAKLGLTSNQYDDLFFPKCVNMHTVKQHHALAMLDQLIETNNAHWRNLPDYAALYVNSEDDNDHE